MEEAWDDMPSVARSIRGLLTRDVALVQRCQCCCRAGSHTAYRYNVYQACVYSNALGVSANRTVHKQGDALESELPQLLLTSITRIQVSVKRCIPKHACFRCVHIETTKVWFENARPQNIPRAAGGVVAERVMRELSLGGKARQL